MAQRLGMFHHEVYERHGLRKVPPFKRNGKGYFPEGREYPNMVEYVTEVEVLGGECGRESQGL